ncbi:hypothetical protein QOZ80_5BG0409770 [Eleusine coracana subsp. coracana]|nr:hypothetical protein QOZ80_5BG0409770 [Eleusine coracana subsp. coracana]
MARNKLVATTTTVLLLLTTVLLMAGAEPPASERSALQAFISGTPHERALGWNASSSACSWTGVTCDKATNNSTVVELRLPGIGLIGRLPSGTLGRLKSLQVISLRSNRLSGSIPDDLFSLPRLRSLFLQGNLLTGALPADIAGLSSSLEHLALSHNNLSGPVPFALNNLMKLKSLMLDGNSFSGSLPSITIHRLDVFNVSDNDLNGSIPASLARFPPESFAGNLHLCGAPLVDRPCHPFFPPSSPPFPPPPGSPDDESNKRKKLSAAAVVAIAVAAAGAALLALVFLVLCLVHHHRRGRKGEQDGSKGATTTTSRGGVTPSSGEMGTGGEFTSSSKEISAAAATAAGLITKLVFVGGNKKQQSFDLEDLLRASAEVLGKGSLGTSYKATLEDGTTVVVKRLRDVAAARREFAACVEAAAAVEHRNLAPMRGYYYSKDEKQLVGDYLPAGSLSARLHGGRGTGRTAMDWGARMRAALCAARGVAHLHTAHNLAHGNIKSSNLLLRPDPDAAALSDYGLNQLFTSSATPAARPITSAAGIIIGYRAPELVDARRPTFKSDVYSVGVLFLEMLTGKSPSSGEVDLPRWVQSVVREEWTASCWGWRRRRRRWWRCCRWPWRASPPRPTRDPTPPTSSGWSRRSLAAPTRPPGAPLPDKCCCLIASVSSHILSQCASVICSRFLLLHVEAALRSRKLVIALEFV